MVGPEAAHEVRFRFECVCILPMPLLPLLFLCHPGRKSCGGQQLQGAEIKVVTRLTKAILGLGTPTIFGNSFNFSLASMQSVKAFIFVIFPSLLLLLFATQRNCNHRWLLLLAVGCCCRYLSVERTKDAAAPGPGLFFLLLLPSSCVRIPFLTSRQLPVAA